MIDCNAAAFVCAPPLRADADRDALWAGLADGTIEVAGTDHCPFTNADRAHGTLADQEHWRTFREIPGGLPGVETLVSLLYQGVRHGKLSVERADGASVLSSPLATALESAGFRAGPRGLRLRS